MSAPANDMAKQSSSENLIESKSNSSGSSGTPRLVGRRFLCFIHRIADQFFEKAGHHRDGRPNGRKLIASDSKKRPYCSDYSLSSSTSSSSSSSPTLPLRPTLSLPGSAQHKPLTKAASTPAQIVGKTLDNLLPPSSPSSASLSPSVITSAVISRLRIKSTSKAPKLQLQNNNCNQATADKAQTTKLNPTPKKVTLTTFPKNFTSTGLKLVNEKKKSLLTNFIKQHGKPSKHERLAKYAATVSRLSNTSGRRRMNLVVKKKISAAARIKQMATIPEESPRCFTPIDAKTPLTPNKKDTNLFVYCNDCHHQETMKNNTVGSTLTAMTTTTNTVACNNSSLTFRRCSKCGGSKAVAVGVPNVPTSEALRSGPVKFLF